MQDSILFWNAVALEANRVSHSDPDKRQQNGPTLSSRALAIVHLAMYDAFAGFAANPALFPGRSGKAYRTPTADRVRAAEDGELNGRYIGVVGDRQTNRHGVPDRCGDRRRGAMGGSPRSISPNGITKAAATRPLIRSSRIGQAEQTRHVGCRFATQTPSWPSPKRSGCVLLRDRNGRRCERRDVGGRTFTAVADSIRA